MNQVIPIYLVSLTIFLMCLFTLSFIITRLECISVPVIKQTNTTGCGIMNQHYINIGLHRVGNLDVVHPKMSPTISFSGMYKKQFIYRRNNTNSQ